MPFPANFRNFKLASYVHKERDKHIGFDGIPYALLNKSMKKGFIFNVLCIGETGIGKSTLMSSLFNTSFESLSCTSPHNLKKVELKPNTYNLQEHDVRLKLTIIESVGYGDQINKEDSYKDIIEYIDAQYELYLREELKVQRNTFNFNDTRIHVCLYFICPTGHGLKAIDLLCLKKLHNKVNLIPIIAKADSISKFEIQKFKEKVRNELQANEIKIYTFPPGENNINNINCTINDHVPFAVVGSTDFVSIENKMIRCREYPWGIVEVENEDHSDFSKLREMLIRTNMEDICDRTHTIYYETYRKNKLQALGFVDSENENTNIYLQNYGNIKNRLIEEMKDKEEKMKKAIVKRVGMATAEIKQEEKEIRAVYKRMKEDLDDKMKALIKSREKLNEDIHEFTRIQSKIPTQQFQLLFSTRKNKKY